MAEGSSYETPAQAAEAEIRRRGSRFRARLVPVGDERAAKASLDRVRDEERSATHHCWAWRLGWPPMERSSDAGEPSGTAGAPILRAIESAGVSDCLLVVSRWFGGTKLGRGGLVRAYGAVARACLEGADLSERVETRRLLLEFPYERTGDVERLLGSERVTIRERSFGEGVLLEVELEVGRLEPLRAALADLGPELRVTVLDQPESRGGDSW